MKLPSRHKRYLRIGFDKTTNQRIALSLDRCYTHIYLAGPSGCGKSRQLLNLFQQLAVIPDASILFESPKGDVVRMARDWAISHGLAHRLRWFSPGEAGEKIMGYDPLKPNALHPAIQAKAVREGIRATTAQDNFDQTQQLGKYLFLALYIARLLCLTLLEAVSLLRPESQVRRAVLPAIADPFVRESLEYLDKQRDARQDQLVASTLARLESFVLDPTLREIFTQQTHSLDMGEVIANHGILLANVEEYNPFRPDDVRLILRLLTNDYIGHVFNRPREQGKPPSACFIIADEVQTAATSDFCRALDKGREAGLCIICASQYLGQLKSKETDGLLAESILTNARTKMIFGDLSVKELADLTPELMNDQFDPRALKDQLTSLEAEPCETTRDVTSEGESISHNLTRTQGTSEGQSHTDTQGQEMSAGRSLGISRETGATETMGETQTYTSGHVSTRGRASSSGDGSGVNHVSGTAESILPDGNGGILPGGDVIHTASQSTTRSANSFTSDTDTAAESEIDTTGQGYSWTRGKQSSLGQNQTTSQNRGVSKSESEAVQKGQSQSVAVGLAGGKTKAVAHTPFHEYKKSRVVSSRQFLSPEEQTLLAMQKIKAQRAGHFVLKVPNHPAVFARAPFVKTPWISARQRETAMQRIYAQDCYSTPDQIEIEETQRAQRIRALLPNPAPPPKMPSAPLAAAKQTKKLTSANKNLTAWDHLADSTEPNTKKSK